jgi:hypothetical protein
LRNIWHFLSDHIDIVKSLYSLFYKKNFIRDHLYWKTMFCWKEGMYLWTGFTVLNGILLQSLVIFLHPFLCSETIV